MSTEEQNQPEQPSPEAKTQAAKAKSAAALGQVFASLAKLKQEKPKVFYGVVGAVALVVLYLIFSGGNPEIISGSGQTSIAVGQSYVLKTPNSAGEKPLVRMVSTPGQIEAYDDTEETDRQGCKNLPEGTRVTIKDLFDAYGKKGTFAKVEILDGECAGKTMWTLSVNVH